MIQRFHFEYVPKRIKNRVSKDALVHCVLSRVIHNSQKVTIAHVSTDKRMDVQNAAYKDASQP